MMKSKDFIKMLQKALNSNTVYALGMWGQVINDSIITSKTRQYPSFYTSARVAQLNSLKGKNYFGFDCVCLVKSILWGWEGSTTKSNGGAKFLAEKYGKTETGGSDAHHPDCAGMAYTVFPKPIKTELDLIEQIRNKENIYPSQIFFNFWNIR